MASVKLEGFDKLLKQFNELEIAKDEKQKWVTQAAESIKKEIKSAAAKLDDEVETKNNLLYGGTLADNIDIKVANDGSEAYVTTGQAYWAIFLEHGTVNTKKKPFFYKSFKKAENKALKKIQKEMKEKLGL